MAASSPSLSSSPALGVPNAGFASAERQRAAEQFLLAHRDGSALGDIIASCVPIQGPWLDACVFRGPDQKTRWLVIPPSLDGLTDAPPSAHNLLERRILRAAHVFRLLSQTREPHRAHPMDYSPPPSEPSPSSARRPAP
jgi:hypothetical protein